jgi:hypothetical protein
MFVMMHYNLLCSLVVTDLFFMLQNMLATRKLYMQKTLKSIILFTKIKI